MVFCTTVTKRTKTYAVALKGEAYCAPVASLMSIFLLSNQKFERREIEEAFSSEVAICPHKQHHVLKQLRPCKHFPVLTGEAVGKDSVSSPAHPQHLQCQAFPVSCCTLQSLSARKHTGVSQCQSLLGRKKVAKSGKKGLSLPHSLRHVRSILSKFFSFSEFKRKSVQ